MRDSSSYLFSKFDLRLVLENQVREMPSEVESLGDNRLLNTSVDDLVSYLENKYRIEPVALDETAISVDQREKDIRVRDWGEEFVRKGTSNKFYVPFSGEAELLQSRASTFTHSPPVAEISGAELVLSFDSTEHDSEKIRTQFLRSLEEIKRNLEWVNRDVGNFNNSVRAKANEIVANRRTRVLANRNLVSSLGFPMRERAGAPKTYSVPEVRRKPVLRPPVSSSAAFKPEPALDQTEYEHILSVIDNMVLVMERSPHAFAGMGEEDLRQHFLVQLNGHYEGQATGETFNYEGKTDILIRVEGRNIFIGECKFWRGPKSFTDTIDQILGYASWRDTKTAILVFNRNKNLSAVVEKLPALIQGHPSFKGFTDYKREAGWRAGFGHKDDPNRELMLTAHVYEVPETGE